MEESLFTLPKELQTWQLGQDLTEISHRESLTAKIEAKIKDHIPEQHRDSIKRISLAWIATEPFAGVAKAVAIPAAAALVFSYAAYVEELALQFQPLAALPRPDGVNFLLWNFIAIEMITVPPRLIACAALYSLQTKLKK